MCRKIKSDRSTPKVKGNSCYDRQMNSSIHAMKSQNYYCNLEKKTFNCRRLSIYKRDHFAFSHHKFSEMNAISVLACITAIVLALGLCQSDQNEDYETDPESSEDDFELDYLKNGTDLQLDYVEPRQPSNNQQRNESVTDTNQSKLDGPRGEVNRSIQVGQLGPDQVRPRYFSRDIMRDTKCYDCGEIKICELRQKRCRQPPCRAVLKCVRRGNALSLNKSNHFLGD